MISHIFTITKDTEIEHLDYICIDINKVTLVKIIDLFKEFIEDGLGDFTLRAKVDSFSSYMGETVQIFDNKNYLFCQICDSKLMNRLGNREITIDELKKSILIHLINENYGL